MTPGGGTINGLADFESAYDTFFRGLSAWFGSKGVPREEARDLAQDTIARAFVHIRRHGVTSGDLWPLLRTIARNLYVERGRKATRRLVPIDEAVEVADDERAPEDLVVEAERHRALHTAIAELAPRHRRVIQLALAGRTANEIARELGIKRNAVDALLHRARRSLATKVEAVAGGLGALISPLVLRLRTFARRSADVALRFDPSGVLTSMMTTVGAAGLVAAAVAASPLGTGAPSGGEPTAHAAMRSPSVTRDVSPSDQATARTSSGAKREGTRIGTTQTHLVTDVRRQHVGAHTTVDRSGNSEDIDVGAYVETDRDSESGISGVVIDRAADIVCSSSGPGC